MLRCGVLVLWLLLAACAKNVPRVSDNYNQSLASPLAVAAGPLEIPITVLKGAHPMSPAPIT